MKTYQDGQAEDFSISEAEHKKRIHLMEKFIDEYKSLQLFL